MNSAIFERGCHLQRMNSKGVCTGLAYRADGEGYNKKTRLGKPNSIICSCERFPQTVNQFQEMIQWSFGWRSQVNNMMVRNETIGRRAKREPTQRPAPILRMRVRTGREQLPE